MHPRLGFAEQLSCIPPTRTPNAQAMFSTWMKFSLDAARAGYDAARLGYEVQTVMTLRLLKFARGGKAAKTEARRMVALCRTRSR